MDDLELPEPRFAAPAAEVGAGVVEGLAELDEHVEGHEEALDVLAAGVVDEGLDGDEGAAALRLAQGGGGEGVESGLDEVLLFLEVPVMEDHPHRDDVGLGDWVLEKVSRGCGHAVLEAGGCDVLPGDGLHGREVERDALHVRVPLRNLNREEAGRAADVAERLVLREVELRREGLEVDPREARHRAQELLELRRVGVERLENPLLPVLLLVLGLAGPKRFRQVVPVAEEAGVEHDEDAADVAGGFFVEEVGALGGVVVEGPGPVAVAAEELHGDEGVEEVGDAARVEAEGFAEVGAGLAAVLAEAGEDAHFDGGEEDLGVPEAEGGLEDRGGV